MALHPNDRPNSVAEWHAALTGASSTPLQNQSAESSAATFRADVQANAWLIATAALLLGWALYLTFGG